MDEFESTVNDLNFMTQIETSQYEGVDDDDKVNIFQRVREYYRICD